VVLAELEIYREMYPISMQALKSAAEYWLHVIKSENSDKYDAYLSSLKPGWCNQRVDLFSFFIGLSAKKEHFYWIFSASSLAWKESVPNAWSFSMSQKEALTTFFFKNDFKAYFTYKALNIHIS
jgi:predicted helicase